MVPCANEKIVQFCLHYNSVFSNQYKEKFRMLKDLCAWGGGFTKRRLSIKKFGVVYSDLQGFRLLKDYCTNQREKIWFALCVGKQC